MRRDDDTALICLSLIFLFFFGTLISGSESLFFRDFLDLSLPSKWFYREFFTWRPSLWNPFISMGYPSFAALHHATFYPLQLLILHGDFLQSVHFYIAIHYLLALSLTYFLSRQLGASEKGSFLAAISYSFSGFLIFRCHGINQFATAAWLPGLLFCFLKAIEKKSVRWLILGSVIGALQILGGEPHFALFGFTIVFCYTFFLSEKPKYILLLFFMLGLGIIMAAIQLIPALEFLEFTRRSHGIEPQAATQWSFFPGRIIEYFYPLYFGNLSPSRNYYWGNYIYDQLRAHPLTITAYIGLVPILIILSQFRIWIRQRNILFWVIAGFIGLLLSFGQFFPGYSIIQKLPFLSVMRFPEKFILIPSFCWAIASSLLWTKFIKDKKPAYRCVFFFFFISVFLFFLQPILFSNVFSSFIPEKNFIQAQLVTRKTIFHSFLISTTLLILLHLFRNKNFNQLLGISILSIAVIDILSVGHQILYRAPYQIKDFSSPILAQVPEIVKSRFLRSEKINPRGIEIQKDPNELAKKFRIGATNLRPNMGLISGVSYTRGYEGVDLQLTENLYHSSTSIFDFLNKTGTQWYLTDFDEKVPPNYALKYFSHRKNLKLWQNPTASPRVYFIADGYSEKIPIENVMFKNEKITFTIKTKENGKLVLNDLYYPGWVSRVNQVERKISLENDFARSIFLEIGEHQIEFSFEPKSLNLGMKISFLGIALALTGLFLSRRLTFLF